ncbi:MAG: hypothetical protein FWD69_17835 [Polyangiaceae bacterium]|nr:hypothetical protein [Polyangiaceae bacterium]
MLAELPIERPAREGAAMSIGEELPPWLSARRTIGGFYVVRALGVGGTASVFVVNRVEDRHEPGAECFALKVPDYTATTARSISQEQMHLSHDGMPMPMRSLIANPEIRSLAEILVSTLRRDPGVRPTAEDLRASIRAVASKVEHVRLPVALELH